MVPADRPISLSIIKGISLPDGAEIGILTQAATTSAQFQGLFARYPVLGGIRKRFNPEWLFALGVG
jgi:hypothetical protein